MKKMIKDLNLGFSDAQGYMQRGNKQMLSEVFVKNVYLDNLLKPSTYYLIGEKGTGKTAYAAYLSNNEHDDNISFIKYISGTDYEKFYELKKRGQIDISGYVDIWKAIILLVLAQSVRNNDRVIAGLGKSNFNKITIAIDEYYNRAFSPEIVNAIKIVDKSEEAAKLVFKYAEIGGDSEQTFEFNEQHLQMNLYYIGRKFSECLGSLKLKKNVTLFIDGIDVRPNQIPYDEYLNCIKGLANAAWTLNSDLFANVRDSKGCFKVVLLLRPDIFNSLNLQNATNKLADNSVYLNWQTTYIEYPTSNLYKMGNRLLAFSQDNKDVADIWESYFTWKLPSSKIEKRPFDTAFMEFLKISLSRPRDIQRILKLLQDIMIEKGKGQEAEFDYSVFASDRFQNDYSEYFLSSLKDQLSFYYSEDDYKYFRKFFNYFSNPQFDYEAYNAAYDKFVDFILDNAKEIPEFADDPKIFLQLLYDSNVIAAIENISGYYHFSYRERSLSNIAPEVPVGGDIIYRFHYGLYKKAGMGRYDK